MVSVGLIALTAMEHERTTSPFRCTEHAPHCATPQPYLVPVRPTCSRMTHRRGVVPSTCTSRVLPLILSFAMLFSSDVPESDSIRVNAGYPRPLPSPSLRDRVGARAAHREVHRGGEKNALQIGRTCCGGSPG